MHLNDLIISAGRKRLSSRTHFVHDEETIPLYENFCFAFALFRQKTIESVKEGKDLIERLLSFQVEGNFPLYLHDYPHCYDFQMPLKVAPFFVYLLRLFGSVLGELKPKIEAFLSQLKPPEKPSWENRYRACKNLPLLPENSISDWTEYLITAQLSGQTHFSLPYDETTQTFLPNEAQEKNEPRPHPIEWLLAQGVYTPRLLRDHPHQLLCAPLFPITFSPIPHPASSFRMIWKGGDVIHSLVAKQLKFDLEEVELGRNDLFEAVLYTNISSEKELLVNGHKATSFQLGDRVSLQTPSRVIHIRFELSQGTGDFCGHIFRANRPSQIAKGYEAYDWQIGLRTLRRSARAQIQIHID